MLLSITDRDRSGVAVGQVSPRRSSISVSNRLHPARARRFRLRPGSLGDVAGAAAAGVFGGIFELQRIADLVGDPGVHDFAFQILGQAPERVLPNVLFIWFAALLLSGTTGRSRMIGWMIVPTVIGLEAGRWARLHPRDRLPVPEAAPVPAARLASDRVGQGTGWSRSRSRRADLGRKPNDGDRAERLTTAIHGETPAPASRNKDRGPDRPTVPMPMVGITWGITPARAIKHQGWVAPDVRDRPAPPVAGPSCPPPAINRPEWAG